MDGVLSSKDLEELLEAEMTVNLELLVAKRSKQGNSKV